MPPHTSPLTPALAYAHENLNWLPLEWKAGLALKRQLDGRVLGRFFQAVLSSVYQPLWDPQHQRSVGYEAFVRCHSAQGQDQGLSPWNLFTLIADDDVLIALDRLCRTLHVLNAPRAAHADELLFLNVHGRLLPAVSDDHGRAFRRVLKALKHTPARMVIELPVSATTQPRLLAHVLANYRLNGFQVAANLSSPEGLGKLLQLVRPNFVKLDARACTEPDTAQEFVALARAYAVQVVFTKVGDLETRTRLESLGAWLQGHAIQAPHSTPGMPSSTAWPSSAEAA